MEYDWLGKFNLYLYSPWGLLIRISSQRYEQKNQTKLEVLWWPKTQLNAHKRLLVDGKVKVETKRKESNENAIVPIGRKPKKSKSQNVDHKDDGNSTQTQTMGGVSATKG
jgi:hypothetical protein